MRDRLPPLDWLRTFEAAARLSSFAAAAEQLGMTQASASHHIRSLEKWLGAPLFDRLPRSVQLTEIGKGYLPAVRRALDDLASATVDLFGTAARKSITIQAPTAFTALWLAPRLHRFAAAHPLIELRLQTANWPSNTPDEEVDIDIRYGDGNWPGFASRKLLDEPAILVCSPRLLPDNPVQSLADIPALPLIHILGTGDLWAGIAAADQAGLKARQLLKADSSVVALELAAGGLGLAFVLRCFAAPYLRDRRLTQPLPLEIGTGQAHFLVSPMERHAVEQYGIGKEVAACRDWLSAEAQSGHI
jgi:LysR family glycine cleavage system transcriptional activator